MKEIEQNPPKIPGFTISRTEYLISLILTNKQDHHPGAWSVLNMTYLRKQVPKADQYIKFLGSEGIIEWKNYSAGRNSRLYRLKVEGGTAYRMITDMRLIRRIENIYVRLNKRNSKKYPKLNEYIHSVKIDLEEALTTVQFTYSKNLINDPEKAERRRTFSLSEIEKINSGDIYIKCNGTNGRLDSNITRLPRELVKHLTIHGNPLTEIDLRNSQPFFAAAMMNLTPETEGLMVKYLGRTLTILTKSLHLTECEDVQLYTSLVVKGDFYEPYMINKIREAGIVCKDREAAKKRLLIVFFDKSEAWKYNKEARVFKSCFPNVMTFFDAIKKEDHTLLSVFLQRIESHIVLNRVAPRIINDFPKLPFVTKHDSLLPSGILAIDNIEGVKRIMIDVIREVTGLTPQVIIKRPENLDFRPEFNFHHIPVSNLLFLLPPIIMLIKCL